MADLKIETCPIQVRTVVHGAEATAPDAAQVLADSGAIQLPPGFGIFLTCKVHIAGQDSAPDFEISHQRAGSDVEVAMVAASTMPGTWSGYFSDVINGDHIIVRTRSAGTTAKVYQASIYLGN